jgi:outer membrane lipoprotein SlyB
MTTESKSRIHPLMAGAAVAVIVFSLVGVAAVTGYLPGSSAQKAEPAPAASSPLSSSAAPVAPSSTPAKQPQAAASPKPTQVASAPAAPAKARCVDCGTVLDVKVVEVKGEGSGLGAVAGGVAGGVLGHEVVDGKNQGIATIAGAAAGAFAGHQIEKHAKTKKRWDVAVRMQDGSTRTVAYAEAPAWKAGDKVRVAGATLEPLK